MTKKKTPEDFGLDEEYFLKLCSLVDVDPDRDFSALLRQLHTIEFSEHTAKLIDNDINRIEDGIQIRRENIEDYDDFEFFYGPCTFLEFLIGMAYRVENVIGEDYISAFWEMMHNLGLDIFDDDHFDLGASQSVDEAIVDFLNRRYARDGKGGLFPIKNPAKDQRKVEIWYQMQTYLIENYL